MALNKSHSEALLRASTTICQSLTHASVTFAKNVLNRELEKVSPVRKTFLKDTMYPPFLAFDYSVRCP